MTKIYRVCMDTLRIAPCKRTTKVLDSGSQHLDSGFQPFGFRIPTFWIPDSIPKWIPDSNSKNLLDSGFRILLHGAIKNVPFCCENFKSRYAVIPCVRQFWSLETQARDAECSCIWKKTRNEYDKDPPTSQHVTFHLASKAISPPCFFFQVNFEKCKKMDSSLVTQTVPVECTRQELSFEWSRHYVSFKRK